MTGILQICQEVADMTATQRPDDLFDKNIHHNAVFLSVAKNELDALMRYGDWQALLKEGRFKTIQGKNFYPFDEIASDFYALMHNTIYLKNDGKKITGALNAEDWMKKKYVKCGCDLNVTFRVENNGFRFLGEVPENLTIVFMYRSNAVCVDAKTFEEKASITKNSDVPIFDKYVVKLGITWRWLKRNGMDYEEEYNEYQRQLKKIFGLELDVKDICLANRKIDFDQNCGVIEHINRE